MIGPHDAYERSLRAGALVALAVLVPLPAAAAPCAGEVGETAQAGCARALYGAGRYTEAAEAFAAMWERTGSARYLYNSALAREARQSLAWAHVLLRRYIDTPGLTDVEIRDARTRSERIRARLSAVDVAVVPAAALGKDAIVFCEREVDGRTEQFSVPLREVARAEGIRLHLDRGLWIVWIDPRSTVDAYNVGGKAHVTSLHVTDSASRARLELKPTMATQRFRVGPPSELRRGVTLALRDPAGIDPDQVESFDGPEFELPLRASRWDYRIRPRGLVGELKVGTVDVSRGEVEALDWTPSDAVVQERSLRRQVILGLTGASTGAAVIGVGLLTGFGVGGPLRCLDMFKAPCNDSTTSLWHRLSDVRKHWNLATLGGGFLGTGVGLGVAAGLEALPPRRARLIVTLVGGGLITVVGAAVHGTVRSEHATRVSEPMNGLVAADGFESRTAAGGWTAAILGLGFGLFVGSGSAALTRRFAGPRAKPRVAAGPGLVGLGLRGEF